MSLNTSSPFPWRHWAKTLARFGLRSRGQCLVPRHEDLGVFILRWPGLACNSSLLSLWFAPPLLHFTPLDPNQLSTQSFRIAHLPET
jgi:hypothetical protein